MFERTNFFTCATRLHGTMQILLQIAILSTVQKHVQFYGYRVNERRIRASFCQFKGKGENQHQTLPTCGVDFGIQTRATLVGGACSYHCVTLASQHPSVFE